MNVESCDFVPISRNVVSCSTPTIRVFDLPCPRHHSDPWFSLTVYWFNVQTLYSYHVPTLPMYISVRSTYFFSINNWHSFFMTHDSNFHRFHALLQHQFFPAFRNTSFPQRQLSTLFVHRKVCSHFPRRISPWFLSNSGNASRRISPWFPSNSGNARLMTPPMSLLQSAPPTALLIASWRPSSMMRPRRRR